MCFAVPGRVGSIDDGVARVLTEQGTMNASLSLLRARDEAVEVGDWVIVSLGLVIDRVDEARGRALFDEHRILLGAAAAEEEP